ncbi:hypothetical protein C4578_04125 [Candidatus Microgenomates bacterium]|nr:MAG: hypothetical protein C4578_04125 [Candidatus Microgenomates bacterium]
MNDYKIGLDSAVIVASLKEKVEISEELAQAISSVIVKNNEKLEKDIPKMLKYQQEKAKMRGLGR